MDDERDEPEVPEDLLLEHITPHGGALPAHLFVNRPFLWLLLGESISAIAFWALLAAEFSDAAFRFHASPTEQFVLWAAFSAPFVLLTPFQSLLVDRWSPKWMNFIGYVMFLAAIPPAVLGHSMPALYLSMLLLGFADAAIQPARSALTGLLVQERHLVRANGMLSAGIQVAGILGPLAGGILIGSTGETTGVYVLATVAALVSLPFFASIRDARHGEDQPAMTLRDLADGAVTSARQPQLRVLMFLSLVMFMSIAVFVALEPLFVKNTMGLPQQAVSFIWAAHAFGAMLGALELTRTKRQGSGKELVFIGLAFVVAGIGALIYVGLATYAMALVGSAIMGVGFSRFFAPSLALIQRVSGADRRGRVTAVFSILEESMGMLAAVVFAALALPLRAVQPAMIGAGIFMFLAGVFALIALRRGAGGPAEPVTGHTATAAG